MWLAMASLLPFARHRVPLPWHAVVEYGFLASDLSRLRAAFKKHGLECNVRRGILKCWFGDGAKLRSVYGNRLLTSFRAQTWPWADLFPHEAGRKGCGGGGGVGRNADLGRGRVGVGDIADPRGPQEDEATRGLRNCLAPEHERLNGKRKIRLDAYRTQRFGGARLLCPTRAEAFLHGSVGSNADRDRRPPPFKNRGGRGPSPRAGSEVGGCR